MPIIPNKMKKTYLLLILSFFIAVAVNAQPGSKLNFSLIRKYQNREYAEKEIAVFVRGNVETIHTLTTEGGGVFKYSSGDIAAVVIPVKSLRLFLESKDII